jgi:hypothetical protein
MFFGPKEPPSDLVGSRIGWPSKSRILSLEPRTNLGKSPPSSKLQEAAKEMEAMALPVQAESQEVCATRDLPRTGIHESSYCMESDTGTLGR